jgi:hypothetical protein
MRKKSRTEAASTKLTPKEFIAASNLAEIRGVSLSSLLHDLVVAALNGRILMDIPAGFEAYSTHKNSPKVAVDDRIQARLVALENREAAADARHDAVRTQKIAFEVDRSKARLKKNEWPEDFNLKEFGIDE